jgi:DNA-binding transcriptional ArsR family regulator
MEDSGYLMALKHSLWNLLAGTRGGVTRIQIIELLRERPYNTNQLHEKLNLDYKTIQHHMRMLMNGNIVTAGEGKKYGSMYFFSPLFEANQGLFDEILEKVGESKINKGDKKTHRGR